MDFFQSIESIFIGNGVITAFLFVGCIIWISYFISNKFTNGKFHGSAIAIIIGLSLAYLGGKVTGGTKGLADITIFSGLAILGGSMFRDFAIVATAYGLDTKELKKAGFAGIFSLGVSQLIFRTFNEYRDKNLNGYFTLILMISILGSILSLPFFLYSNDELFSFDDQISEIVESIFFTIFLYVLISARIFYISFESILRMTKNITFMSFIQNIVLKGTPLIL